MSSGPRAITPSTDPTSTTTAPARSTGVRQQTSTSARCCALRVSLQKCQWARPAPFLTHGAVTFTRRNRCPLAASGVESVTVTVRSPVPESETVLSDPTGTVAAPPAL